MLVGYQKSTPRKKIQKMLRLGRRRRKAAGADKKYVHIRKVCNAGFNKTIKLLERGMA